MVVLTKMNVMTVGMERLEDLKRMPIRLLQRLNAADAVRSFKQDPVDSVICRWNLPDMPNGQFVYKLRRVRPDMPIIAIVEANEPEQEIAARMIGATVVPDDCGDGCVRRILESILGLPEGVPELLHADVNT